jgi:mutator protein MutT
MGNNMKNHAVIILHNGNKVLFIQRSAAKKSLPNIWAFPSGTMEEGEDKRTTLVREAKEELGININIEKEIGSVELPELEARLYFIVCKGDSLKDIVFDPNEIQKARWLTFKEFFSEYKDNQIGHGLIYLRKHPEIWEEI